MASVRYTASRNSSQAVDSTRPKERKASSGVATRRATMSVEQFQQWANRRSKLPLAVRGHSFVMTGDNVILVDGGKFVYEEALRLVRMLNSRNPIDALNANTMIWERNGTLRLVVLGLIALILVVVV